MYCHIPSRTAQHSTFSMYPDFLNTDLFVSWQFQYEKNYAFDPEDHHIPWFMLDDTELYSSDDWEQFDIEPFLSIPSNRPLFSEV